MAGASGGHAVPRPEGGPARAVVLVGYGENPAGRWWSPTPGDPGRSKGSSATLGISVLARGQGRGASGGRRFPETQPPAGTSTSTAWLKDSRRESRSLTARKLPAAGSARSSSTPGWRRAAWSSFLDSSARTRSARPGAAGRARRLAASSRTSSPLMDEPAQAGRGRQLDLRRRRAVPPRRRRWWTGGSSRSSSHDALYGEQGRPAFQRQRQPRSYKGLPGPRPRTSTSRPGPTQRDRIISETRTACWSWRSWACTTDPASGGDLRGRLGHRHRGRTLDPRCRQRMHDIGQHHGSHGAVDMVGDDLDFLRKPGLATFRISHMTVA